MPWTVKCTNFMGLFITDITISPLNISCFTWWMIVIAYAAQFINVVCVCLKINTLFLLFLVSFTVSPLFDFLLDAFTISSFSFVKERKLMRVWGFLWSDFCFSELMISKLTAPIAFLWDFICFFFGPIHISYLSFYLQIWHAGKTVVYSFVFSL